MKAHKDKTNASEGGNTGHNLLRLDDLWMDGRLAVSTSTRTSLSTEVDVTNYDDTTIQYTDNPPTFYEHYIQF